MMKLDADELAKAKTAWWKERLPALGRSILAVLREEIEAGKVSWTSGITRYREPVAWPWASWREMTPEDRRREAPRLAETFASDPAHGLGHVLTGGAVVVRSAAGPRVICPFPWGESQRGEERPSVLRRFREAAALRWVDDGPLSGVVCGDRDRVVKAYRLRMKAEAETSGREPITPTRLEEAVDELLGQAAATQGGNLAWMFWSLRIGPIVVDERYGIAYRPIVSAVRALETRGFALTSAGGYDEYAATYVDPPDRYADAFWRMMERWLEAEAASGPTTTTTTLPPETIPPPLPPPPALETANSPTETRLLLDGPTRRDAEAAAIVCGLRGLRLAKRWKKAELLDEIMEREARQLVKAGLEEAIKAGMLTRKYPRGQERIDLTDRAKREVMKGLAISGQPFLRLERGWLEFTRVIRTGDEIVEVGVSWLGGAELLVKAARETKAVRLRDQIAELGELPLLADTPDHRRELAILRMGLGQIAACSDAEPILEYVLDVFGRDGRNPVEIPHWTLSGLLDHPRDHWPRVEMALNMLLVLNVAARETGIGGRERGALVSHWEYLPKGAGASTDGDWRISLNDRAVGCLRVFLDPKRAAASAASAKTERLAKVKVKAAPKDKPAPAPQEYDWAKADLDKETAATLRYWQRPTAMAAFLPKAWSLTDAEARLLDWVLENITRRKARRGKPSELARFTRDMCPLLGDDDWHGAMGNGKPFQRGRYGWRLAQAETLRTRSGGGRPAGIIQAMGLDWPPGVAVERRRKTVAQALETLRTLVEDKFGGLVAGTSRGREWWRPHEAEKRLADGAATADELADTTWSVFLPLDWMKRVHAAIERYHEAARERGDVAYRVEITTDRDAAKAAEANRGLALSEAISASLRDRIRAARKRLELSQTEAAALFRVSRQLWTAWETGEKPIPPKRAEALERWAASGRSGDT